MLEFVSQLPGETYVNEGRPSRAALEGIFAELAARPGEWAVLEKGVPISRINTWKARAERLTENGSFVFASVGDPDAKTIYARFVGTDI